MTYAIRVKDQYVGLMGRYVTEGQAIVPGAPLLDIMTPQGVVETIKSEGWGVVAHIEGGRIFHGYANDDIDPDDLDEFLDSDDEDESEDGESGESRSSSGGMGIVFSRGDVICHIVARSSEGNARKAGLHPRPSPSARMRRLMGVAPG